MFETATNHQLHVSASVWSHEGELRQCAEGLAYPRRMAKSSKSRAAERRKLRERKRRASRPAPGAKRPRGKNEPAPEQHAVYWACAFLDMLGYATALEALDVPFAPLPADGSADEHVERALLRVVRMKGRFRDMFKQLGSESQWSGSKCDAVGHVLAPDFRREEGPDNMVLSCMLAVENGDFRRRIHTVTNLVADTAAAMLVQLAAPDEGDLIAPIRGGIEVALGAVVPRTRDAIGDPARSDLFTPALSMAYALESRDARVPRTIVSERFVRAIDEYAAVPGLGAAAAQIRGFLFKDTHGPLREDGTPWTAIDFFGEHVRSHTETGDARRAGTDAWDNARRGLDLAANNPNVRAKYEYLVAYLGERLPLWGVKG